MMEPIPIKEEHHHHAQHHHHHPHHNQHNAEYAHNPWGNVGSEYSPHTQSPAAEYPSYTYSVPPHSVGMPMEPSIQHSLASIYSSPHIPQPLYTTQWPSMMTNPSMQPPSHMTAPHINAPPEFVGPPVLPRLTTHTGSTRRTLTDQDRRRMCQYHEDHPNVKQTEIGAMFGVERSTVSKVLRQREKYLFQQDPGSEAQANKKPKGKLPDIERALANWARNHQKSGLLLTDNIIRDKARFFAATVGSADCAAKVNSASWLEKFKQKNHLLGERGRKGSDVSEIGLDSVSSGNATPNGLSPVSPNGYIPSTLSHAQSSEQLKSESPDSYAEGLYKHGHPQSATSLASCYTDATAPSSFSPQSPSSPFFVGDPSKMHAQQSLHNSPATNYPSTTSGSYSGPTTLANGPAPVQEYHPQRLSISCETPNSHPASNVHSPVHGSPASMFPTGSLSHGSPPSQDDARKALELVMTFFHHQPSGIVDAQEYITMVKLMEKLKMRGSVGGLPGGMHSIDLIQTQKEMSRKRSVQGLI